MTQTQGAYPPRFWWLKRLSLAAGLCLLLLTLAWCLWYWYANHVLSQQIAHLRAAGHPVTRADLDQPFIPDQENALPLIKQAFSLSPNVDVPASSNMSYSEDLPLPPAWHAMMNQAYPAYQPIYPLVRQARQLGQVYYPPLPATGSLINVALPSLAPYRQLANVLGDTALYHHFRGDDAAALETIRDTLFLGDAIGKYPFLISKLVDLGIHNLALQQLQIICTTLQIAPPDAPPSTNPSGPASRAEVQALLHILNSSAIPQQVLIQSLYEENLYTHDMVETLQPRITRPLFLLGVAGEFSSKETYAAAFAQPNYPSARLTLEQLKKNKLPNLAANYRRVTRPSFSTLTLDRMAAVSLALALYRADHHHYPASLAELVPTYLPSLPLDPMSARNDSFGYLIAAAGKRPLLISAGEDGIRQTTDESFVPSRACYSWHETQKNRCDDIYLDLAPWKDPSPPPPPPTLPEDASPN